MGLTFKVYKGDELVTTETFDREIIKIGRLSSAHLRYRAYNFVLAISQLSWTSQCSLMNVAAGFESRR